MQAPAAMFIESAKDSLERGDLPVIIRTEQIKELRAAVAGSSKTFEDGYELGLQVARVTIATNVELRLKGIDPKDLL